jgi:cytochrome oxidase assembly protein ShyY1
MTKPTGPTPEDKNAQARRDTVNLLAVIICLVILIVGFWLVNRLWEMKKLQDCIFAGRRDCAPIETTR